MQITSKKLDINAMFNKAGKASVEKNPALQPAFNDDELKEAEALAASEYPSQASNKAAQAEVLKVEPATSTEPPKSAPKGLKAAARPSDEPKPLGKLQSSSLARSEKLSDFAEVKKRLAMMKAFTPLFSALAYNPGKLDAESAEAAKTLINETVEMTRDICGLLKVDPDDPEVQWVVTSARYMASELVQKQWRQMRATGETGFRRGLFLQAFQVLLESEMPTQVNDSFPRMGASTRIQMSMMNCISEVVKDLDIFESILSGPDFHKGFRFDKEAILPEIGNFMVSTANKHVVAQGFKPADEARLTFFQNTLNSIASVYTSAVRNQLDSLLDKADAMKPDERKAFFKEYLKENPAGLDIKPCAAIATTVFGTLANLASKAATDYGTAIADENLQPKKKGRRMNSGGI